MKRGSIRRFITVSVVIVGVGYLGIYAYESRRAVLSPQTHKETLVVEKCWGVQIVHRELDGVPEPDQLHCLNRAKRKPTASTPLQDSIPTDIPSADGNQQQGEQP